MATITYKDVNGDCPRTTWFGEAFEDGKSVKTDNTDLIKAATGNPWFTVSGAGPADGDQDTPTLRGAAAARDDKPRSVPPAYRGKAEGDQWLDGYDSVKPPAP